MKASVLASATIDFVVVDATEKGKILQLECEVVEGGVQGVHLHPNSVLTTWIDQDFLDAVRLGWNAARHKTSSPASPIQQGFGRFRVLEQNDGGKPTTYRGKITGGSVGGAAFLGWARALTKTVPDPGVIVLTGIKEETNGTFKLVPVDELPAKVAAIVSQPRFDTIAVASQVQEQVAVNQLSGQDPPRVTVKNLGG